jgi:hypothetical protein
VKLTLTDLEGKPYEDCEDLEIDDKLWERVLKKCEEIGVTPEQFVRSALVGKCFEERE